MTGSARLFGDGETIAQTLRARVKKELDLTISVGVSFNKIFAKLGSDLKKPDAVTCIPRQTFRAQIWDLPADSMLGVGRSTGKCLADVGIHTIGQLAKAYVPMLESRLGKCGVMIWQYANGLDDSPVNVGRTPIKSIGRGETPPRDLTDNEQVRYLMLALSQDVARRLRENGLQATGIQVAIRDARLITRQFQDELPEPTANARELCRAAFALFEQQYRWERGIRSVTVRAIRLVRADEPQQLDMFCDYRRREKTERIDRVADALRDKYGECLCCASLLGRG